MTHPRWRLLLILICLQACEAEAPPLFRQIPSAYSCLSFQNIIAESDTLDPVLHTNMYNGAGVAIADINQDQLPDILLAGNMVPSRLYLNQGNLRFRDISESAGILNQSWNTGISLADLNLDGCPDIYLSCSMTPSSSGRKNLLYLSTNCLQGEIPRYREVGEQAGLADTAFHNSDCFL